MSRLRVVSPTGLGNDCRVEVDGHDISHGCRAVTIRAPIDELVVATVDLAVVTGEFDGEARVIIPEPTHDALVRLGWTPPVGPVDAGAVDPLTLGRAGRRHGREPALGA